MIWVALLSITPLWSPLKRRGDYGRSIAGQPQLDLELLLPDSLDGSLEAEEFQFGSCERVEFDLALFET